MVKMTQQELWDVVNAAGTMAEIQDAERIVGQSDVDNETYDELMNTLAFKTRELYHRRDA